jgi:hypothetical protein
VTLCQTPVAPTFRADPRPRRGEYARQPFTSLRALGANVLSAWRRDAHGVPSV